MTSDLIGLMEFLIGLLTEITDADEDHVEDLDLLIIEVLDELHLCSLLGTSHEEHTNHSGVGFDDAVEACDACFSFTSDESELATCKEIMTLLACFASDSVHGVSWTLGVDE
jgi:hypothetical protein